MSNIRYALIAVLFLMIGCLATVGLTAGYKEEGKTCRTLTEARKHCQENNLPLLVVYTADWCGPCKLFKREFIADPKLILNQYCVLFVNIDTDKDSVEILKQESAYNIQGNIPEFTIYNLEDGKFQMKKSTVGFNSYNGILQFLGVK